MAEVSGKPFLNDGTQQDAEEFFRALDECLSSELLVSEEFRRYRSSHWGRQEVRRNFKDNTKDGRCHNCHQYPSTREEPFIVLQLNLPRSSSPISLSSIIENHYSESTNTEKIRCTHCCPHDDQGVKCTQRGLCRAREATECYQLTEAPEFLFIQLLRYDGTMNKIMTFVQIESETVLPNQETYEHTSQS